MSRATEMHGFLPEDYVELKTQRRTNLLWALVFLIVAGGIGWAYFIAQDKIRKAEMDNALANEEFAAAAGPIQQFKEMQEKQQQLNQKAELVGSLIERVNRSNILAALTNSLPKRVYLTEVDLTGKPSTVAAPAATAFERARAEAATVGKPIIFDVRMRVRGLAFSDDLVASYTMNLERANLFSEVNFIESREHMFRETRLREFELEVVLDSTADSRIVELQASKD